MFWLATFAAAFVGSHLLLANEPARGAIVRRVGERAFLALYSILALVLIVALVAAYNRAPYVPLWTPGPGLRGQALVIMPLAFILLAAGYLTPNPTAVMQEGRLKGGKEARGIMKITRHPIMWAIVLWAAAHILANGDVASLVLMGGFLVLAAVGMVLLDGKKAGRAGSDWKPFAATSSVWPFAALAAGRVHLRVAEIGWGRIGAGLALFLVFLGLHDWLFGASPLPR